MIPRPFSSLLPLLAVLCAVAAAQPGSRAADAQMTVFDTSVKRVAAGVKIGPNDQRHAYIKRSELQPAEIAGEMRFEVALKMRNFAELQARIGKGEIIPFAEMAVKYFPTKEDYQSVAAWLTGQGFKIIRQDDNHLAIFATGSVGAIQKGLRVNFARVSLEGEEYTSAITAPSVPAAISPLLVGINGLQPHIRAHKHLVKRPDSLTGTGQPYTPAQILRAYSANSAVITGSGQTIAIVIDTFPRFVDLTSFWSTYGVAATGTANITGIQCVPGTLASPSGEESLDTEWSSSIAPQAKVRIYATLDLLSADTDMGYQQVYADVVAHPEYNIHQMSMSYGIGELDTTASQAFTDSQYFANLASAGVTIFASTGDNGNDPDDDSVVQVENPASDPSVTGVGGTTLTLTSGTAIATETGWSFSSGDGAGGGGLSVFFSRPTWQTKSGVYSGGARAVPDVSAAADPDEGAYYTLNGVQGSIGGTSWSSPTWAGFCALINQYRASVGLPPLGLLGPKIYPLAGTSSFHDITVGNNGYAATSGYDLVTGIGTPNVLNLVTALSVQPALVVPTTPAVTTLTPGSNATFTVASSGTGNGYTYQWQRMPISSGTWSNITASGTYAGPATTALTVEGIIPAMSGDQFQCVIHTGTGTITTSPSSVLVVDNQLVVTTLAGKAPDNGPGNGTGINARFNLPSGVAVDSSGNIYVADYGNDAIRKVTPAGVVTTPYGQHGVSGTANGTGTNALFNSPNGLAIDSSNNIYVADTGNNSIRKITSAGVVSTIAGSGTLSGTANGPGSSARFLSPEGVAVDAAGDVLYVADTGNSTIRKITASGVTTLAGSPTSFGWYDATGTAAEFNGPTGVAIDSSGNVYVADFYNYVVRKVTTAGVVTTVYGQPGVSGTLDGIGTGALFNSPMGIAVDGSNNIYVADSLIPLVNPTLNGNNNLRRINPAGVVSTIAGTPNVTGTANGTGPAAQFDSVEAVAVNSSGVVYLADSFNQTVRAGGLAPLLTTVQGTQTVNAGQSATFSVDAAGSGTITYQWFFSGTAILSATNSSYTINFTNPGNTGNYTVQATDPYGTGTSTTYTLTVDSIIPALSGWLLAGLVLLLFLAAAPFLRVKPSQD